MSALETYIKTTRPADTEFGFPPRFVCPPNFDQHGPICIERCRDQFIDIGNNRCILHPQVAAERAAQAARAAAAADAARAAEAARTAEAARAAEAARTAQAAAALAQQREKEAEAARIQASVQDSVRRMQAAMQASIDSVRAAQSASGSMITAKAMGEPGAGSMIIASAKSTVMSRATGILSVPVGLLTTPGGKCISISLGSDDSIWICLDNTDIYRQRNRESAWDKIPGAAIQVNAATYNSAIVRNAAGALYEYVGGSNVWRVLPDTGSGNKWVAISDDSKTIWKIQNDRAFTLTGSSWTSAGLDPISHLSIGDKDNIWVVGTNGTAMSTDNASANFGDSHTRVSRVGVSAEGMRVVCLANSKIYSLHSDNTWKNIAGLNDYTDINDVSVNKNYMIFSRTDGKLYYCSALAGTAEATTIPRASAPVIPAGADCSAILAAETNKCAIATAALTARINNLIAAADAKKTLLSGNLDKVKTGTNMTKLQTNIASGGGRRKNRYFLSRKLKARSSRKKRTSGSKSRRRR